MTTKTLTGHYTSGYTLSASYSELDLTGTATVGGATGPAGLAPVAPPTVAVPVRSSSE